MTGVNHLPELRFSKPDLVDTSAPTLVSIITPAYNESANLPILYERLHQVMSVLDIQWEWIVVDDHSSDQTLAVLSQIIEHDPKVHAIRFARNFGSHSAITCGLNAARGACAIVLAADLQDPPEKFPEMLEKWYAGAQVVWAVRAQRPGESASTKGFSRLYYSLMRNVVGIKEISSTGADFFLLDRRVIDAFCGFGERNVSIFVLITWMGFRQTSVTYDKQARIHGRSGWSLEKKLKLIIDSVTSFTYLPIRLMSYTGIILALIGFLYAVFIVFNVIVNGSPVQGWSSLMVVVLLMGGLQMVMMGVLGEYMWRTWDDTRARPRYIIEAVVENNNPE